MALWIWIQKSSVRAKLFATFRSCVGFTESQRMTLLGSLIRV